MIVFMVMFNLSSERILYIGVVIGVEKKYTYIGVVDLLRRYEDEYINKITINPRSFR